MIYRELIHQKWGQMSTFIDACFRTNMFGSLLTWSRSPKVRRLHCWFDAMQCGDLSECLHLLMWVNQHGHIVGVWILNPRGEQGLSTDGVVHSSPAVRLCLWGWRHPVRVLTARTADGQWSGATRVPVPHWGSDPVAEAKRSGRVWSIVAAYLALVMRFFFFFPPNPTAWRQVSQCASIFKEEGSVWLTHISVVNSISLSQSAAGC